MIHQLSTSLPLYHRNEREREREREKDWIIEGRVTIMITGHKMKWPVLKWTKTSPVEFVKKSQVKIAWLEITRNEPVSLFITLFLFLTHSPSLSLSLSLSLALCHPMNKRRWMHQVSFHFNFTTILECASEWLCDRCYLPFFHRIEKRVKWIKCHTKKREREREMDVKATQVTDCPLKFTRTQFK